MGTCGPRSMICAIFFPAGITCVIGQMVMGSPILSPFCLCVHHIFNFFYIMSWGQHRLAPAWGTGPSLNDPCSQDNGDHLADSVKSGCLASCYHSVARVGTGLYPTTSTKHCGMSPWCGEGVEGKQIITGKHHPGPATNWFCDIRYSNFSALSLSFFHL